MKTPDIIFITTDTQGREAISAYGCVSDAATPNIDRLAGEGVLYQNAYNTCPLCTPARSSWYTGMHPNRNGALANDVPVTRHVPMLAELLGANGYRCRHFGKWHLDGGGYNGRGGTDGGFEEPYWYDLTSFMDEVGREGINRFGGWNRGLKDEQYCFGHRVIDNAIDSLQELAAGEQSFFLAVELDEPHGPYICPPPFRGSCTHQRIWRPPTFMEDMTGKPELQKHYSRFLADARPNPQEYPRYYHKYWDCNAFADYEIGRLLDAIDRYCGENTVTIFTSDHGDHLGSFGLCAKGPTMYDLTIGVPLVIRAPGLKRGLHSSALVSSVDVWATILDYAGLETAEVGLDPANGYTGRSLRPIMQDSSGSIRDELFVEYNRFGRFHHQADGFYPIRCIRTADWKLAVNLFDRDELYNVREDPWERTNRIDDPAHAGIRNELHDRLLAWQEETKDVLRSHQWARRPWRSDYRRRFEGLFTTGYKDPWESGSFFD